MSQVTDISQRYDPFGNASYSTASNPWAGFFGSPPYPYKTTSYDKYDRHNWNLPEAYVGQNLMLKSTVDEMIYTDEDWYTTVALPYKFTDQVSVAWDKWEFNEHFTNIVPEQGVSRLVSSHKEQRSESFVRRGLAAIFEHGFMSTPEGRANYVLTLRQIARAVKETTNFGVIYAYLTAHNYNRTWEEKHGYFRKQTLTEILSRQKYMWAIAQKEKNGMEKLDAQIVEWMNRYRGEADTWILPPKMTIYLRLVPAEKTDYYLAGEEGPRRVNQISGAGRPHESNGIGKRIHDIVEPFAVFKKNNVFISRTYHVDRTGPIDMLARVSQIGEFNKMIGEKECDPQNYKSCHRSIRVYDETNDCGVNLSIQDALDYCNLFDGNGDLRMISDSRESNDAQDMLQDFLLRQTSDPQSGRTTFSNVKYFGDINEQFMSTKSIGALAQTVINSIFASEQERLASNEKLNAGMAIINSRNMQPFPAAVVPVAARDLAPVAGLDAGSGRDQAAVDRDTAARPRDLATMAAGPGATSWSALKLNATNTAGGPIALFVQEVETIASRLSAILNPGDNIFLDAGNAGPWNYNGDKTAAATFYENLLNYRAVPVFLLGAGRDANVDAGSAALQTAMATMRAGLKDPNTAEVAALVANGTRTGLEALADYLRRNLNLTKSNDANQLGQWLRHILEAHAEAPQADAARDYNAPAQTILMAYPENPTFKDGDQRVWELASRFDLTRPRDQIRAANARDRSTPSIGSEWHANEMPLFVGIAAAQNAAERARQTGPERRDDSYRTGSGLARSYAPVGQMLDLNVGRIQEQRVWLPAAGGALAAGGEAVNLRIGNIAYLLNKISTSPMNMLQKLASAVYLGAPVKKNVLNTMIEAQVIFPMNFILARPHARYEMALGIKTKAGSDTGQTYFGHSNFMLADDATVKIHYGNYTHYGKSVVHNEKNVFIAYDIFANAALGGLGVRPYIHGQLNYKPDMAQQPNQGYGADMFVFAIPYEERDIPNPLDISGRFYTYMDKGFIDAEDPTQRKLHYTTAPRYNRMWGFYNPANVMDEVDEPLYRSQFANVNRVCWQGAQGGFNPETRKFDVIIRNTGHWGPDVATGVKDARNGRMHEIEKVPFGVLGF